MRHSLSARRVVLISFLLFSIAAVAQQPFTVSPAVEKRIDALLQKMTVEEKVGQLVQYSAGSPTGPGTGRNDYPDMIAAGQVGSLFNLSGAKKTNEMQRIAVEKSRMHIPLIFGQDVIHGLRTTFPVPLAMSSTWDIPLIEQSARIAALEAATEGIRWTFSPMVDIARDARWGRITEGAGEDPYLGSLVAAAYVRGYQGTKLNDPMSIAACVKHYVGYGAAEGGRDYNTTDMSERTLRQIYLPPFHAAENAGAATFMSAFNSLDGVSSSANAFTLRQVLRKEWGFRGFVVSDWNSVGELIPQGLALDPSQAAEKAVLAGVNMDMESNAYHTSLVQLVRLGAVPMATLNEAVREVLRVKFALGLFDHPYADESKSAMEGPLPEASRETARKAAEESFVLLKNASVNGTPVLPLQAKAGRTIALIGPMADDAVNMAGSWGGLAQKDDVVTLYKALTDFVAKSNMKLVYQKGVSLVEPENQGSDDIPAAVEAARRADVVLLALGDDAGLMSGEAASRAHLKMAANQRKLINEITALGKPTVMILFSGRPLVLTDVEPKLSTILLAWYPGVEAGPALVNTLFGMSNPSGRLTATFPRAVGQEPLYYDYLNTGRPALNADLTHLPRNGEEKYLSRYIDEQNSPLYPFGYGLSYSTFSFTQPKLSATTTSAAALNARKPGSEVHVTAEVKNTSSRAGTEIVQLYVGQRGTSVARPVHELEGFQRLTLGPGESKTVEFTIGRDQLAFWNIDMKDVVEPAKVNVWVAPNSAITAQPVEFEIKP
ncbi:MAG: beta-glucosidase BglX [Terriglobia bacterium]|jgi:beta-glucosidase|nr:beta-glucosidase BglX [Terriglobia bacterium]